MRKLDERVQQYNTEAHNRLWERCLAAEKENEMLREALEKSMIAVDDWLHIFASDMCKEEHVAATWARIFKEGGTIAYIADTQARNRAALGDRHE